MPRCPPHCLLKADGPSVFRPQLSLQHRRGHGADIGFGVLRIQIAGVELDRLFDILILVEQLSAW